MAYEEGTAPVPGAEPAVPELLDEFGGPRGAAGHRRAAPRLRRHIARISQLRAAYPNYYADTSMFTDFVESQLGGRVRV
jgi:hypothetical protein